MNEAFWIIEVAHIYNHGVLPRLNESSATHASVRAFHNYPVGSCRCHICSVAKVIIRRNDKPGRLPSCGQKCSSCGIVFACQKWKHACLCWRCYIWKQRHNFGQCCCLQALQGIFCFQSGQLAQPRKHVSFSFEPHLAKSYIHICHIQTLISGFALCQARGVGQQHF